MPQCARLDVTPVVANASAIATIDKKPWTWQWDGTQLRIRGVENGTRVALYDLRGILISSTVSTGDDVLTATGTGRNFILKVGEVNRIVYRQ